MALIWGEDDWVFGPVGSGKRLEEEEDSIFDRLRQRVAESVAAVKAATPPPVEEPWQEPMPEGPLETWYPEAVPDAPMYTGFEDEYTVGAPYAEDAAPPEMFSGSDVPSWGIQQEPTFLDDLLSALLPSGGTFSDRLAAQLDGDPWANVEDLRPSPVVDTPWWESVSVPEAPTAPALDDTWLTGAAPEDDFPAGPNSPSFLDQLAGVFSRKTSSLTDAFEDVPDRVLRASRVAEAEPVMTDWFGNPKYTLNEETGQYDEARNPVMGADGDVGNFLSTLALDSLGAFGKAATAGQTYVTGPALVGFADFMQGINPRHVDQRSTKERYWDAVEQNQKLVSGEVPLVPAAPDWADPIIGAGYQAVTDPGSYITGGVAAKAVPEAVPASGAIRGLLDSGGITAAMGANVGAAGAGVAAEQAGIDDPWLNVLLSLAGGITGGVAGAAAPSVPRAVDAAGNRLDNIDIPATTRQMIGAGEYGGSLPPDSEWFARKPTFTPPDPELRNLADIAATQAGQREATDIARGDFRLEQASAYAKAAEEVFAQTGDERLADLAGRAAMQFGMDKSIDVTITPEQASAARLYVRQQWEMAAPGTWDFNRLEGNRIITKLETGQRLQPAEQDFAMKLFGTPESPIADVVAPQAALRTELYDGPNSVRNPLWKPLEGVQDAETPLAVAPTADEISAAQQAQRVSRDTDLENPLTPSVGRYEFLLGPHPGTAIDQWLADTRTKLSGISPDEKATLARVSGTVDNKWAATLLDQKQRLESMLQYEGIGTLAREERDALRSKLGRTKTYYTALEEAEKRSKAQLDALTDEAVKRVIDETFPAGTPENVKLSLDAGNAPLSNASIRGLRTFSRMMRNTMFGVSDIGAVMQQGLGAATSSPQIVVGTLNRLLDAVGAPHVNVYGSADEGLERIRAGGRPGQLTGTVTNPLSQEGTIFSPVLRRAGTIGKTADSSMNSFADTLNEIQFGKLMGALNTTAYEGNMIIAKLAQKMGLPIDANSMQTKEAMMRLANASTLRGKLSQTANRRVLEEQAMLSPSMRRAQADLMLIAANSLNPTATAADRMAASLAIAGTATTLALGYALNESTNVAEMDLNPFNGGFGRTVINAPGSQRDIVVDLLPQRQVQEAIAQAFTNIGSGDMQSFLGDLGEFAVKGTSPGGRFVLSWPGIGYSPETGVRWFEDPSGRSRLEVIRDSLPVPPGILAFLNGSNEDPSLGEGIPYQAMLNFIGANTYYESKFDAATQQMVKDGLLKDINGNPIVAQRYKDLAEYPLAKKLLIDANPSILDMEPTPENQKLAALLDQQKQFKMTSIKQYVDGEIRNGDFREQLAANNQAIGMLASGMVDEAKKHEGEEWRLLEQYYGTFVTDPATGQLDNDATAAAQNAFWTSLGAREPQVRAYIYAYSDIGDSEPEKAYHDDIRRLNGYDPETGQRLVDDDGNPLPNYFEMQRYNLLPDGYTQDEALELRKNAEDWYKRKVADLKKTLPPGTIVEEAPTTEQIYQYMEQVEGVPGNDRRIVNVLRVGTTKWETPEYKQYKREHEDWLSWFDADLTWPTMQLLRK